jgi:hypothetical protein
MSTVASFKFPKTPWIVFFEDNEEKEEVTARGDGFVFLNPFII